MKCRRPYMVGVLECPCGGCLPCRINRRRVWAHRLLLESYKHRDNCFVTLTYDDAHLPSGLVKSHYQLWLKRLRKKLAPQKVRYFISGEYGEISGRPHFHAAIFGLDRFLAGGLDGTAGVVQSSWVDSSGASMGFTFVGELSFASASYVAGYLTKKLGGSDEFSRMSLRPGLGASAVKDIASSVQTGIRARVMAELGDVPSTLRHGGRTLPLGRYLRGRLRLLLSGSDKAPPAAARLSVLRKAAEALAERDYYAAQGFKPWEVHKIVLDKRAQQINNVESRFKIFTSKGKL